MIEKKASKKTTKKIPTATTTKSKAKSKVKPKSKKEPQEDYADGIAIVDDDLSIDQEKVNEERRAYLEEARSQDASD